MQSTTTVYHENKQCGFCPRQLLSPVRGRYMAVANGPVGQVLVGALFLKVKTKLHFTKSK